MCDLFSWIEGKDGRIYYNTDEDIEIAGMSFVDGIGHSAIEEIWKVEGEHIEQSNKESLIKVPKELAEAVNRGKCVKMAKAGGAAGVHYDVKAGASYGEIDAPWWPKALIEEAKTLKYFDNHAEPLPEWRMFENWTAAYDAVWAANKDAVRNAASDSAWDAARAAASEAARSAAYDAALATAYAAARVAASEAARSAAYDAVWTAAYDAVWAANKDAALLASFLVAFYGKKKNKHITYANKRWEVWQRGYGCLCDIDGVLYCYQRP